MTQSKSHRRRRRIVDADFQGRHLTRALLTMFGVAVTTVFLTLAVDRLLLVNVSGPYWTTITLYVVGLCGAFTLFLVWLSFRISHRIAGPMVRFRAIMGDLKEGHIPHACRIREGDEHQAVAEAFHDALAAMRRRRDLQALAWREQAEALRVLVAEVKPEMAQMLEEMAENADSRAEELAA